MTDGKRGPRKIYHDYFQINVPAGWREKVARVAGAREMTQSAWLRQVIREALIRAGEFKAAKGEHVI